MAEEAAAPTGAADRASEAATETPFAASAAAAPSNGRRTAGWEPRRQAPPSAAPVELTLDLRGTAPDKALSRLLGALERVSDDVTLVALLRDTPEFAAAMSSIYSGLRSRGYWSDSSRYPAGVQRVRIARRRGQRGSAPPAARDGAEQEEPGYAPAPSEIALER